MLAIFLYVGVEVSTASNLPEFMKQKLGTAEHEIAPYVSLFWASLMIGRWASAAGSFGVSASAQKVLNIILPFVAFGIFLLVNVIAGHPIAQFYPYLALVVLLILADMYTEGKPTKQLFTYSLLGILSLLVGIFASGMISVFAFISVGLFCSTLWPCVFTLGITGLGKHTNTGSSLLIMMIMGGGFVSMFQGALSDDAILGIQMSYFVGVACFAYLAFYALKVRGILKSQGIDVDAQQMSGGH